MADPALLEAELAAADIAADPDTWALAAYRVAMAKSELASNRDDLADSLKLLEKAGRILTAERAPQEHGRIQTALGNCYRAAGRADLAGEAFNRAANLLAGRAGVAEQAAALVNVGLARAEAGDGSESLTALDEAVDLLTNDDGGENGYEHGDEAARTLGAALLNRAQAHQSLASDMHLEAAVADYRAAVNALPLESPQSAMASHGLATALLEQDRRRNRPGASSVGETPPLVDQAIAALNQSLAVFTLNGFPFQHAIVRHSLAVALQRRGEQARAESESEFEYEFARAAHHGGLALSIFDPRLHQTQWSTANQTITEIEAVLAPRSRSAAIVDLLAGVDEDERTLLFRERLVPMTEWPEVRSAADLNQMAVALTELDTDTYQVVVQSMISVLMELPDRLLELACRSFVAANHHADTGGYDRALDDAINARLFGPQRVRVRDLLEANGWQRP